MVADLDVVGLRRLFHRHPETAFTEFWTSTTIAAELRRLGWAVRTGTDVLDLAAVPALPDDDERARAAERALAWGADPVLVEDVRSGATAVVADLHGNRPGPTTALRVDIDALPLTESTASGHAPVREGFRAADDAAMHACGHDGHIAIGLDVARRLTDRDFPGTVRLLVQPAEEGGRGAAAMLAAGVLDGVDQLYAIHLGLGLPSGTVAPAHSFFANVKLHAVFHGRQAHAAAAPEQGRHALLAAAGATVGLHALPRFSTADTRLNVGMLHGGTAPNIIPASAELRMELRATDGAVCDELERRARQVITAAGDAQDVGVEIHRIGAATTAHADLRAAALVQRVAERLEGVQVLGGHRAGVSDDATVLMRAVQDTGGLACYLVLGSASPAPHHSPDFDIDESSLAMGADVLEGVVRQADTA